MTIAQIQEKGLGERPGWDEYFMAMAILASTRSSCRHVQAGSLIVVGNQVRATGYNGAAPQYENCFDMGCRKEAKGLDYEKSLGSGECEGIHAEMNALGHLDKKEGRKITIYTTLFPCHSCAKNLMPYNLEQVVFKSLYSGKEFDNTLKYLEKGRVKVARLDLSPSRLVDIILACNKSKFNVWTPEDREYIAKIIPKKEDVNKEEK